MKIRPATLPILLLLFAGLALAQGGRFAVQLEALPVRAEAEEKINQLKAQGVEAYLVKSNVPGKGVFHRIRVGNFPSRAAAEKYAQQLKTKGAVADFFIAAFEAPDTAPAAADRSALKTAAPDSTAPKTNRPAPAATPKLVVATSSSTSLPPTAPKESPKPGTPAAHVASDATKPPAPMTNPPPGNTAAPTTVPAANATVPVVSAASFTRYQDPGAGYSFEHPQYWQGGPLTVEEMQSQRVSAGAMFKSNEDAAFLNAIWNKLDKANSAEHDNDMVVDLILKSMGSGNGTQTLTATSRRLVSEGPIIKTYVDLRAAFQVPNQPVPLDFMGKAVIIRAAKGILLVVAFYSKEASQNVAMTAERIVQTARVPE